MFPSKPLSIGISLARDSRVQPSRHSSPHLDWLWSVGFSRAMHGLSILFATPAVLLGWAPPQHPPPHRSSTPHHTRTQEDAVAASDPRSIDLVDGLTDLTLLANLGGEDDVAGVTADPGQVDIEFDLPPVMPGLEIVDRALPLLGTRYVWGGTTPSGFDCSGFVYFVLNQSGHPVPRDHGGQMRVGDRVPRTELEPGDLVFFQNTYMPGI